MDRAIPAGFQPEPGKAAWVPAFACMTGGLSYKPPYPDGHNKPGVNHGRVAAEKSDHGSFAVNLGNDSSQLRGLRGGQLINFVLQTSY